MSKLIIALSLCLVCGYLFAKEDLVITGRGALPAREKEKKTKQAEVQPMAKSKPISLNFKAIKVRTVLQLLAEFTGINMVVSDKVTGRISLRLKEVPWEQALAIILRSRSLSKRQIGNVMLIAPAEEIIEREKKKLVFNLILVICFLFVLISYN